MLEVAHHCEKECNVVLSEVPFVHIRGPRSQESKDDCDEHE